MSKQSVKPIGLLNDVLGPVMRGPSSSHTAAPFRIGSLARALLGDEPAVATLAFDPRGSWAEVYHQQGSDLGFAAGLMGWPITDERFPEALTRAAAQGFQIAFVTQLLPETDHPNTVQIQLVSRGGRTILVVAKSVGGGAVVVERLEGWPVHLTGDAYDLLVEVDEATAPAVSEVVMQDGQCMGLPTEQARAGNKLVHARRRSPLAADVRDYLESLAGVRQIWAAPAIVFPQCGAALFSSATEMVARAEESGCSLGRVAMAYESELLGLTEREVLDETIRRFEVMRASVHRGLGGDLPAMQLLQPCARQIYQAEAAGKVAAGGMHTRAAARAMAVMHVNSGMGVVCAAPTAGSAGTIPGVVVTIDEELGLNREGTALTLLAAGAVGVIVATRATFAAEVAGCQVEIGASGAMAAAAVVEAAGGSARQACDAAAISFQNTMGSVCDLVQGVVEIPCHTRNAVAASSAFVCADLIMGGYVNPIPLDETIDAVYAVGRMLPRELKVTALGGLALAPSAQAMPRRDWPAS
jgi:L-serine dehydratase